MSQTVYQAALDRVIAAAPALADSLPKRWPERVELVDRRATIAVLRDEAAMVNTGLLVIGWGDGTACELLAQDPLSRQKLINVVILPDEADAFAHALGSGRAATVLAHPRISIHFCKDLDHAQNQLRMAYGQHMDIARLAGTTIIDRHPLGAGAAARRAEWAPRLHQTLVERFDCLGNDVYDTFMGAKHALMQGRALATRRRASQLTGRWLGHGAICIASGPSGAEHLARIRDIQREHVVIVADSMLAGALAAGIEPDFVCMVERPEGMNKLIDGHADRTAAHLVALPLVHPTSSKPFGERVIWWWNNDDLYPWLDPDEPRLHSGRSAGTHTVALAAHLGCGRAWLVGHDLAFRDGKSHAPGAAPFAVESQAEFNRTLSRTSTNYYATLMDVARNGGGTVETTGVWNIFRSDIEMLIGVHPGTAFHNVNTDCGAVIAGTTAGELPMATGVALDKSLPPHTPDLPRWDALRDRARKLVADFDAIATAATAIARKLDGARPMSLGNAEIEHLSKSLDISRMVCAENRALFTYILRAAHRNLMVRLHHNTHVRTMVERDWNQVQVMRMYAETLPALVARLRPELVAAVEDFR